MDGRLRYRGRVEGKSPGCRSLKALVGGCLVALLHNAVASGLCHYGCDAVMSPPRRPGWQEERAKGEASRTTLCMVEPPGPSRGISLPRVRRSCVATPTAQDLGVSAPSSTCTGWGMGSSATTAWPATHHGRTPGKPNAMGGPLPSKEPRREEGSKEARPGRQGMAPRMSVLPGTSLTTSTKASWRRSWRSQMRLPGMRLWLCSSP